MLVNNAAVVHGKSLMDSDDDALLKSQHVNTLGQFWVRPAGLQQQLAAASLRGSCSADCPHHFHFPLPA